MRSTRGSTFDPIRSSPFYQHPLTPNSQDVVSSGDTARHTDIVMNGTNVGYNTAMQDSHQVLSLGIDSPEYAKGFSLEYERESTTNGHAASVPPASSSRSLEQLGRGIKQLVDIVTELRQTGVEEVIKPLPKIVVVGDQSTGKSSLIEGLSELKVPRSEGKCTSCPLEISITQNEKDEVWKCSVVLVKHFAYDPGLMKTSRSSSSNEYLGPWTPWNAEETPFKTVNRKDDLENVLFWAQKATLNPMVEPEKYISLCDTCNYRDEAVKDIVTHTNAAKFSPNVVRVNICGPNLPNLSFVDLPGVISTADNGEEDYLVDVVKNLMIRYIRPKSTLILLTLSMTADAATSTAYSIIRQQKKEDVTIGVLTKPDRVLGTGALKQWEEIMTGQKFPLRRGYFICKQPSQSELLDRSYTHEQARFKETEFFNKQEWRQAFGHIGDPIDQVARYGTVNLQTALSQHLSELILYELPYITEQVATRLQTVEEELERLPKPPDENSLMLVFSRIDFLHNQLNKHVDGSRGYTHFRSRWLKISKVFQKAVTALRPGLIVRDVQPHRSPAKRAPEQQTPTPKRVRYSSERIEIDIEEEEQSPIRMRRAVEPDDLSFPPARHQAKKFTIREIKRTIDETAMNGLNIVDPMVYHTLITESVQHWDEPLSHFLSVTAELIKKLLTEQVDQAFGNYRLTPLFDKVKLISEEYQNNLIEEQREDLMKLYYLESHQAWFSNEKDHANECQKALVQFLEMRRNARAEQYIDDQIRKGELRLKNDQQQIESQKVAALKKVSDEQLGDDPCLKQIEVMAHVRAYYAIAHKRFIDNVCMSIMGTLFVRLGEGVREAFTEGLGLLGDDASANSKALLTENSEREKLRAKLNRQKGILESAQEKLGSLRDANPALALAVDERQVEAISVKEEDFFLPESPSERTVARKSARYL